MGREWVFVGCNSWADSWMYVGVAERPEGPWEVVRLIEAPQRTPQPDFKFTYCMFAHPWAADVGKGELVVSWSEGGMRGKVCVAKVGFRREGEVVVEEDSREGNERRKEGLRKREEGEKKGVVGRVFGRLGCF